MSFDRLAAHYDWLEALTAGNILQRARTAWLEELRDRRHILSVGEGHGRFAAACAYRFPDAELTCVEASGPMLAKAKKRSAALPATIEWVHADFFAWKPEANYDAIVTCFFLDCFTPELLTTAIEKLSAFASADATWLVVDFAVPPRGAAHWRARAVHALMYTFFRLFTALSACQMTPPDDLLRRHGFQLEGRREFEWGLLRADLWRRTPHL